MCISQQAYVDAQYIEWLWVYVILVSPPPWGFVCLCDRERGRSFIQSSVKWKFDACPRAPSIFFLWDLNKKGCYQPGSSKSNDKLIDRLKCDTSTFTTSVQKSRATPNFAWKIRCIWSHLLKHVQLYMDI